MKKQSINCDVRVEGLDQFWKGKDFALLPNTTYTLIIDYPFSQVAYFPIKVKANGMGLVELLPRIGKAYVTKYQIAEDDEYDDYWHGIGDLTIEGINIDHVKKTIKLDVGS